MPLILGDFTFADFEIPDKIGGIGGKQALTKHRLIGGARVVDAMGPDDDDLEWSGRFRGVDAAGRAQFLDAMRVAGQELPLSFGSYFYTVVIEEFVCDYEREYQILYRIKCFVVSSDQEAGSIIPSLDALVGADLATFASLVTTFVNAA